MEPVKSLLIALALLVSCGSIPAVAGGTDPLFVNMTTDDAHRANMALTFGGSQLQRGHPLTVFLNDKGVLVGSKTGASKYAEHQKALSELMNKGALVIACPMCMRHYGVKESDLLPGIKLGNPDFTGGVLFKDGTRTLTW